MAGGAPTEWLDEFICNQARDENHAGDAEEEQAIGSAFKPPPTVFIFRTNTEVSEYASREEDHCVDCDKVVGNALNHAWGSEYVKQPDDSETNANESRGH